MNYFLDTNVIVGYTLNYDMWNRYAKKIFEKNEDKYWSTTVKYESEGKIFKLEYCYDYFFTSLIKLIEEDQHIKKESFFTMAKNIELPLKCGIDKINIAKTIWYDGGWYEDANSNDLLILLEKSRFQIHKDINREFQTCQSKLILHQRCEKYYELFDQIASLKIADSRKKIHKEDNLILLDAHDLGYEIKINFISSDYELLQFKELIKEITEIDEMTYLKDLT